MREWGAPWALSSQSALVLMKENSSILLYPADTHTQTNHIGFFPTVICLQKLVAYIHLSAPPAAGAQYASAQLIKMPAEFTSGRPGCKFLPGSVAWQADTRPLDAHGGKWMKSNEARVIMKPILRWLTFNQGAAPCSRLLWACETVNTVRNHPSAHPRAVGGLWASVRNNVKVDTNTRPTGMKLVP